ncbi:hypothetical protein AGMMS49593_10540 [Endomicrobiia bacterium]|nr:hypothetical protein AGMMS49593_10540 [Endomicrobiia bacterium]
MTKEDKELNQRSTQKLTKEDKELNREISSDDEDLVKKFIVYIRAFSPIECQYPTPLHTLIILVS